MRIQKSFTLEISKAWTDRDSLRYESTIKREFVGKVVFLLNSIYCNTTAIPIPSETILKKKPGFRN
jgi:hypothetical protein